MQLPVPLPVWLRPVVGPGVCVKARWQTQVSCVGGQCVEAPPPRFPSPLDLGLGAGARWRFVQHTAGRQEWPGEQEAGVT